MVRTGLVIIAIVIGLGTAHAGEGSADAARAEQAFREGSFDQAMTLANSALQAGGLTAAEEAHVYGRRGSLHLLFGELHAARSDFDASISLQTNDRLGYWGLATVRTLMADDAAAAGAARSALTVAPGDYESMTLLGFASWKLGDNEVARTGLRNAQKLNSQRGIAWAILAAMALQDGRSSEAQSLFQEAGKRRGAAEVLMLAIMGASEGNKERAVEFACIAYRADPAYDRAGLMLELLDTAPAAC